MKKYKYILIQIAFLCLPTCILGQTLTSEVDPQESSVMTKIQASSESKASSSNWLSVVALVVSLIAISGTVMAFLKLLSLEKRLELFKDNIKKNRAEIKANLDFITGNITTLSSMVKLLDSNVQAYQLKITSLSPDTTDRTILQQSVKKNEGTKYPTIEPQQRTAPRPVKTLFAGAPHNGAFTKTTTTNYISGQSLYTIDDNGESICQYTYIDNVETAIIGARSLSSFVESGCVVNDSKPQFKRIKTIKPGNVRRISTGWVIVTKAVVQLL